MKERPILFSDAMVRAILNDEKTQTRRVVKLPSWADPSFAWPKIAQGTTILNHKDTGRYVELPCLYGDVGDRLWVREAWAWNPEDGTNYTYRATNPTWPYHWAPSIFMPRTASRLLLEVIGKRIEPLQAITEVDAMAEGVRDRAAFSRLWDNLNAKRGCSWESNPFVWVIEFRKVTA